MLRIYKGMTQDGLAKKLGLSRLQFQRTEGGKCTSSLKKMCEIAEALEVDVTDLMRTDLFILNIKKTWEEFIKQN